MAYIYDPPFPAQHLKLDLFPARVTEVSDNDTPLGAELRVFITDSHFYAITEGVEQPEALVLEELASAEGSGSSGYTVKTRNNRVFHVIRNVSCGCGSRLRGFQPFPFAPYERM